MPALPVQVERSVTRFLSAVDARAPGLVTGFYLVGSVALDDFHATGTGRGRLGTASDIDFVAVTDRRLTAAEVAAVAAAHAAVSRVPSFDGLFLTWADLVAGPDACPDVPCAQEGNFVPSGRFGLGPVTFCELAWHGIAVRGPSEVEAWADRDALHAFTLDNLRTYWRPWRGPVCPESVRPAVGADHRGEPGPANRWGGREAELPQPLGAATGHARVRGRHHRGRAGAGAQPRGVARKLGGRFRACRTSVGAVSYEDPRAYLLGLEGLALLRAYAGEHDRDFVEARLGEIRRVLADDTLADAAVEVRRVDAVEGYRLWSATYDEPNTAFDLDEPVVRAIIGDLPVGVALDAACGTGRHAEWLAARGHQVIGVDGSPDMLALARERVPDGEFLLGDLAKLPVEDAGVDLVVCALALAHVAELGPVFAEFARVLRPGGHLVIADMHPERIALGSVPSVLDADGRRGRIRTHRHLIGDYLRAAFAAGLQVRRCEEPGLPEAPQAEPASGPGPWQVWPWSLAAMVPEAARAAGKGLPALVVWQFQR